MSFDSVNVAAQAFAEANMGETFSYTPPLGGSGVTTSGLVGVFNEVSIEETFSDFSSKLVTAYTLISGKAQWGAVVPVNSGTVTNASINYSITKADGSDSAGEPAYMLTLKRLT